MTTVAGDRVWSCCTRKVTHWTGWPPTSHSTPRPSSSGGSGHTFALKVGGDPKAANSYADLRRAAQGHLKVLRQFLDGGNKPRRSVSRRVRGVLGWRIMAAALEQRAADEARQDADVLAFRRDVLKGAVVTPTHAAVQEWFRATSSRRRRG